MDIRVLHVPDNLGQALAAGTHLDPAVVGALVMAKDVRDAAEREAINIIQHAQQQAQQQAQRIIEQAQQQAADLLAQQEAAVSGDKAALLARAEADIDRLLKRVYEALPLVIENILFRIIGAFDEHDLTARCIAMGIEELRDAACITVKVNAQDMPMLSRLLAPWLRSGSDGVVQIEEDSFVEVGNCTLVTDIGTVELSVAKQLQAFIDALTSAFTADQSSVG